MDTMLKRKMGICMVSVDLGRNDIIAYVIMIVIIKLTIEGPKQRSPRKTPANPE